MLRNIISAILVSVVVLQLQALNVVNTAGGLSGKVTDKNITTLTVSGTMDASDFYFISGNLHRLQDLDLSSVTVVASRSAKGYYWKHEFEANTLPVGALASLKLKTLQLPRDITAIGKAALADCALLSSITLPTSLVTIGDYAFAGCESLTAVVLPASVTTVGRGAFMRCKALKRFTVAKSSQLATLDATALLDCPELETVSLGPSLQQVGERALAGTGIKQLDLSQNSQLSSVGDWALVNAPVTQAALPEGLTTLGDGAFLYDTGLTAIQLGGKLEQISDYLLAGTALSGDLTIEGVSRVGNYALYNLSGLSVVELPATLTWMGDYAMAGMTGMTALTSNAAQVPALGENVWAGVNQHDVPLTVPKSSLQGYKAAPQWQEFLFPATWLRGDVNGDGEINIADINVLIDIILGSIPDDDTMLRADVNEDGEVNIADINAVLDIILNPNMLMAGQVDIDDQLSLEDVAMRPGEERTLSLRLTNAGEYSALQCDIVLPPGLTMLGVKAGKGRVTRTAEVMGDASRVALYSVKHEPFDDEVVLAVTVRADAALSAESMITLANVVLSDDNNVGWHAADFSAQVTNSTGVEDLMAGADRVWTRGRAVMIDARTAGTALITSVNGMSREVSVDQGLNTVEMEPGFYVVTINGRSHKIVIK